MTAAVHAQSSGVEGFLEPYRSIDIAAPEPGILKSLQVVEGTVVTAGSVVAELNSEVLETALRIAEESSEARGKLESAQAELRLAETMLIKLQELVGRSLATPQEIERAQVERDVAAARLLAVEEELTIRRLEARRIEAEIDIRRLRSPIDGVVTVQHRDVGEYVSPADPLVATVVQLDPLTAVFAAPQIVVATLKFDAEVLVRVGDAEQPIAGVVEFVSPLVDPRSGTGQVKVRIPNPERQYRSGERCFLVPPKARQVAEKPQDVVEASP